MTNIFDTHAHYASRQFDGDRADLLAALPRGGVVGVLECATHSGDAQKVLELAHTAPYFHAANKPLGFFFIGIYLSTN